jgi:hypothetical protein
MCKKSCCPGNTGGGLGALAAIAAIVLIAAIARPVIHAAETMLRVAVEIAAITLSVIASLAVITAVAVIVIRLRCNRHNTAPVLTQRPQAIMLPATRAVPQRWSHRPQIQGRPQFQGNPAGHREPGQHHAQPCAGCTEVTQPGRSAGHDWRWP